jgi:hypothetical protein
MNMNKQEEEIAKDIIYAIKRLSFGDQSGPTGMEAISMAIAGEGTPGHDSVAAGLHDVASAIRDLASVICEKQS